MVSVHNTRRQCAAASLACVVALAACATKAQAQTTVFTYQGQLTEGGVPANGVYTVTFSLWDAASGGTLIAGPLASGVSVSDGLFTVPINFGADAFNTDGERWLEIEVNSVTLSARQQVTRAPFAMRTRGIFVESDNDVGIGTSAPMAKLHVLSNVPNGVAVLGSDIGGGTSGRGVFGATSDGYGVFGYASTGIGVFGVNVDPAGWAAYFQGRGVVSEQLLVGRLNTVTEAEYFGMHAPVLGGYGGMYVSTAGGSALPFYGYAAGGDADMWHYYNGGTGAWHVINGDPINARLTVESGGQVGVGIATPGFTLHVDGSAGKPGGGSWSNSSDIRLKKNVVDLDGALEQLLALRGVSFEYIDPESINELPGQRIGMIAQEVEHVFPDWVDVKEDGYKTLTFRGFEALTVEALREIRAEKDAEITALRERVEQLELLVQQLLAPRQAESR